MVQVALIGIAAGVAAALLVASLAAGSLMAMFLFNLAPLPVIIAGLGWSHAAGLTASLVAGLGLAAAFGPLFCLTFLIGVALPAWWLSYLSLLARPGTASGPSGLEWYPVGRLVIWAALLGTIGGGMLSVMLDPASFRAWLKRAFEMILHANAESSDPVRLDSGLEADFDQILDVLVVAIPPAAAAVSSLTILGNLWLAGQIVRVSGRLKRPWPDLAAMTFPRWSAILFGGAVLCAILPALTDLLPTIAGRLSSVLAGSLLMAYAILGLAVLHATTRGLKSRRLVLAGAYATVAVFHWAVLLMMLIGLADSAMDIRGRIARRRGPPSRPPSA